MALSHATTQQPSVELILLRWMLASSAVELSNVDLANCSNLNRKWRRETQQAILEQASASASATASSTALMKFPLLLLPSMVHAILCDHPKGEEVVEEQQEDDDGQQRKKSNTVRRHHHPRAPPAETYCAAWFASEGVQQIEISLKDDVATSTSTVTTNAMQHEGYQHSNNDHSNPRLLSVDDNHNESSSPIKSALTNSNSSKNTVREQQHQPTMTSFSFMTPNSKFVLPAGINHGGENGGHHDANNNNNNNNDNSPKPNTTMMMSKNPPHGTTIPVCYEWQGYSTAPQVLRPFSYCPMFVNNVLQAAVALLLVNKNLNHHNESMLLDNNNNNDEKNDDDDDQRALSLHRMVAVRGATTARPESYCQCVDAKQAQAHVDLSLNNNNDGSDPHPPPHHWSPMSLPEPPEKRQRIEQYLKRIEHVQRDVCPRIITRRNGGTAVQFLNAATSHAVCMMTPLFDQPLQHTVITIFCVGIATEDGCFLSGLFRRLELGHLYPHSILHAATELSAICVASGGDGVVNVAAVVDTDDEQEKENDHDGDENERQHQAKAQPEQPEQDQQQQQQQQQQRQQQKQSVKKLQSNDNDHHDDHDHDHDQDDDDTNSSMDNDNGNDDDDNDAQLISARQCKCQFRGVCEKSVTLSTNGEDDDDQDDDDDDEDHDDNDSVEPPFVSRGQTGPGAWHCYTAVIDPFAGTTLIRVDGIQESSSSESNNNNTTNPHVVLDGLTLGSDHNFGMSLCCGGMSDGSGQGAMAEVAVFAGRLPASDVICIEQHLMRKHDIYVIPPTSSATMMMTQSLPSSTTEDQQQQQQQQQRDDSSHWHREAHALLVMDDTAVSVTNQPDGSTAGRAVSHHHVPLRYLARHRAVAWKQTDPVTGQAKRIQRIGCRLDAESSDFD
jgi:hypothetical protein